MSEQADLFGDDEDLPFIAAPASDPPSQPARSTRERRCAFYRSTDQEGRRPGQFPIRPTLLVGPRRVRRFQDNCRGAAEFEATTRSGWRPPAQARNQWRNLPAAEPPPPYIGPGGRQHQCLEPWYLDYLRGQARVLPETRRLY